MANLQLPNPVTFTQRVAALEQALSGALVPSVTVTVTSVNGAAGNYTYVVVAKYPPVAVPSKASTTTGPTSLSATNTNTVTWTPALALAEGSIVPTYDVYRTSGGTTQGKIASNVTGVDLQNNVLPLQVIDNGLVADGSVAPPFNTTSVITGGRQTIVVPMSASGAVMGGVGGIVQLNGAGAVAATLAAPIAGTQDGLEVTFLATTAQAHTVTTPANGINGSTHIATFAAAIGNQIKFVAIGGVWYVTGNTGVTLS